MGLIAEADEFHAQMASNEENVSIWWRHHVLLLKADCDFQPLWCFTW